MEIIGELLLSVLSVGLGFAVGAVALAVVVAIRRVLGHVARSTEIADPAGAVWGVRVVYGLNQTLARRLAGMTPEARRRRRARGGSDLGVDESELWHPKRLLDFDELAGLVAPLVLVAAVLLFVVAILETLIALPIAIAFGIYCTVRGRWQVVRVDPHGNRTVFDARSFSEARDVAERVRSEIQSAPADHPYNGG